jgi:hypothetical protein
MGTINDLLTSRAVWTAVIGLATTLVLRYAQIPAEVWQSVVALFTVIVAKFTVDDLGLTIGRTIALTMREERQKEQE